MLKHQVLVMCISSNLFECFLSSVAGELLRAILDGYGGHCVLDFAAEVMKTKDSKAKRRFETFNLTILILLLGFGATVTKQETLKGVTGKR